MQADWREKTAADISTLTDTARRYRTERGITLPKTYPSVPPDPEWERFVREQSGQRHKGVHNGSKTHCKQGHRFTDENTKVDDRGYRVCRACHNRSAREYRQRLSTETL